jgi:hypothetical protein
MAKDPAFLFYSADFMIGTMLLSMEEKGQYITLLCAMHQTGRLTVEDMENVLHCKVSKNVLEKFKKDSENKYYSERLEKETNKRKEFTQSRRKSLEIDNGDMVHLYIIKDPVKSVYKIGSSKYPYLRLKEVVKYKPGAEFYWISEGLHERINEKKLHEKYAEKKEKYDWFFLDSKDLENIVRDFRTENENENENENDNDNENRNRNGIENLDFSKIGGLGERWNQKPDHDQLKMELPDMKVYAIIELFGLTKNQKVTKDQVLSLWKIFKVQNFTGENFYQTENKVYSHFLNWCKTQNIEKIEQKETKNFQSSAPPLRRL